MNRKAFTAIELVVALSLSALITLTVAYSLSVFLRTLDKINADIETNQISSIVLDRISFDIRSSKGIDSLSGPDQLIVKTDSGTVTYDQVESKVRRKKDRFIAYLSAGEELGRLSFEYPRPGLVKVDLGNSFSTQAYVRN